MKLLTDHVVSRVTHEAFEFFYTGRDNGQFDPDESEPGRVYLRDTVVLGSAVADCSDGTVLDLRHDS
jgi:hypothetical protein